MQSLTCKRCSAYASLVKSLEAQIVYLRAELAELRKVTVVNEEAIATLASERAANAQLTDELEIALKKLEEK